MSQRAGGARLFCGAAVVAVVLLDLVARPIWAQQQGPQPQSPSPTAPAPAVAPAGAAGGERVIEVQIEGLNRVEREAALSGVKTKAGAAYDEAQVTLDLRAIWQTGFFRDVRVEREAAAGGHRVVFVVVEKPSIREVRYVGHDDVSEDDIKGVVDVKPYTVLDVDLIKRNLEKVKDLYVQKGYYLAAVDYRVEPVSAAEREVDVVFVIAENAKVLVKQISFIGNKNLSDDLLKSGMQTREGGELSFLTQSGTYKEEYFQTDLFRIQAAYYDHGFVTVRVGEPTATISPDRRFIYLSVPITEGEKYAVGSVKFSGDVVLKDEQGAVVVDEERLRERLTVSPGEIFNRTKLFNDINALTDVYRDHGYAFANVTPNSSIREDAREVDLDLEVERGDMVYFDRIEIVGNTRTRDKVIRRELQIYEGDRYGSSGLNASRARVFALGYFETVNVTTARGSKPDRMDVRVEVKEKSTGTFQVGAGFSSVESIMLQAQIAQNNFLGNGWLVSLSAQLSFGEYARKIASLQFYDPYFLDTDWSLGFDAYSTQRYYRDFQRNSTGVSPRLGYLLTPDLRLSAGYTIERVDISTGDINAANGQSLFNLIGEGLNSAVNANLAYDTRDNRLFPSRGHYHVLSAELSHPTLGSDPDFSFWRTQMFLRYYFPLPFSFVFKINTELGIVGGIDGRTAPISERFFPGGILSVRGFEPRGLGPTVPTLNVGDPASPTTPFAIGGNKQAIVNLELEFQIIEGAGIKGVLFADAGNAYNDDENFFYLNTPRDLQPKAYLMRSNREIQPPFGLFYSFGFGFRWFSPIGPLRFEWGIPITKPQPTSRGIIFEFTIGNSF